MFIGRENELSTLNKLYNSDKFEFAVIYGRRRVGKTALISHFITDKPAIYLMGVESNAGQNLENFSRSIMEYSGPEGFDATFSSFQAALESVFRLSLKKRLILAIDEYPYIARVVPHLASTLQLLIDKFKDNSKLMLILCGSSMSYMEDQVLAYKAPLYGRRSAQLKLLPFEFKEVFQYANSFSPEERALIYGLVGGTPQYLLNIDNKLSLNENIKNLYLNPASPLYEEPINILKQEVREPAIYTAIITAIACGASRLAEIAGKVGEPSNVCATYLKNLLTLGLVQKEEPYGEKSTKKSIYYLSDNMFRFWYRFVPENVSLIARGAIDLAYRRIEPQLPAYMGKVFEEISRQYLWELLLRGKSPLEFRSLGRWWGNDPQNKCQAEIDIIGEEDSHSALFAECKWTSEKVETATLETLLQRSRLLNYAEKHYFIFSKSGFSAGCQKRAAELGNVTLVSYEEMAREFGGEAGH